MGLDMYAFTSTKKPEKPVDFREADADELFYWRKHPDLHGWMFALYKSKGGEKDADGFNCTAVELTADDLDKLERDLNQGSLPHTTGFFFGESRPEDLERTREFIALAREALKEGKTVFYDSWW